MGWPLESWQREALALGKRQTVLVSPRQCGKSRSLSVLAVWWAYRRPGQLVLIVSAGDEAAGRLLRTMQSITSHPLLSGSVVDETQHRVILSNGSEIRSVPASERQVRGWSVDLLLVDECAFVSEDLLVSAALPTTAARRDARVVLASSPWSDAGPFHAFAAAGEDPADPYTVTFRWRLADAWWISPAVVEAARASMSPLRFRAEFDGEFVGAGDAYFAMGDILACVADFPLVADGAGMPGVAGLDWGRRQDAHAVVVAGLLDDFGANGRPVVVVPWAETSRRPYGAQVAAVERLARSWRLEVIRSEVNGVGAFPSEQLAERVGGWARVAQSATTQGGKEDAYGRVAVLLAERGIVLPQHEELLRQLGGITAAATPSGGLRIAARTESVHDDLPDALTLAVAGLPRQLGMPARRDAPEGTGWAETPAGVLVPLPARTLPPGLDWGEPYDPARRQDRGGQAAEGGEQPPNPWLDVYGPQGDDAPQRLAALRALPQGGRAALPGLAVLLDRLEAVGDDQGEAVAGDAEVAGAGRVGEEREPLAEHGLAGVLVVGEVDAPAEFPREPGEQGPVLGVLAGFVEVEVLALVEEGEGLEGEVGVADDLVHVWRPFACRPGGAPGAGKVSHGQRAYSGVFFFAGSASCPFSFRRRSLPIPVRKERTSMSTGNDRNAAPAIGLCTTKK